MLEDDLIAILRGRRVVLNNALEALHQYRNITSQVRGICWLAVSFSWYSLSRAVRGKTLFEAGLIRMI